MSRVRRTSTSPVHGYLEGRPVVFMPLQDGTCAVTTPDALEGIRQAGYSGAWTLNGNGQDDHLYVRTVQPGGYGRKGRLRSVAALIAGADQDHQCHFRNGDRRDLRPSNLALVPRVGRREVPDLFHLDWDAPMAA